MSCVVGKRRKAPDFGEADKLAQLRQERGTGHFEKTVKIPLELDTDRIQAQLTDGVLQIELPKPEKAKPRQITIQ